MEHKILKALKMPTMLVHKPRAGLRHVRSVWPNRAADFRGPPFWTPKIFRIN